MRQDSTEEWSQQGKITFFGIVWLRVSETTPTAERWAAVCVEGLEPSHDRRTGSRSRFVNLLKSERAAFVLASTSRPLPPLREDYGALK